MNERPPFTTLRLTTPPMNHPSVAWLQERINESRYVRPALPVDGVFGPATDQETEALLYRLGAPVPMEAVGPATLAILWRWHATNALPPDWRARRLARMAARFKRDAGISIRSWIGLHPGVYAPRPTDKIVIVSRETLGLRPSRGTTSVAQSPEDGAVVHWQGPGTAAEGMEAAAAQWRGFQAYHMDTHGWNDIGYHFAIPRGCPVGTVFEGRGFGVRGAHSGHNVANARLGILVGCGEENPVPTPDQLTTLSMFLEAYARGPLTGHQEWSPTSCPGPALMAWVRANR